MEEASNYQEKRMRTRRKHARTQGTGLHLPKRKRKSTPPTSAQLQMELKHEQYRCRYSSVMRSTIYTLLVVAAAAVLVATLFLPVLRIYGSSMTPTVTAGDIVVSVKGSEFQPGDLIGFYYQNSILVKRVIATSGDWVDMDKDGNVYVNGEPLEEPYLKDGAKAYGTVTISLPYQVGEGRVFVMGDHRSTSVDSRAEEVGCVAEELIIGKIVFRIWPFKVFGSIG